MGSVNVFLETLNQNHNLTTSDRPGRRRAFLQACGCPSCVPRALAPTQMPVHISCNWLKKRIWQMAAQCLTKQSCQIELYIDRYRLYTWGFDRAVSALDVALQLEWSHVLSVAMLASCVAFPALTVLLFQLQVVLHMVHEPARTDRHMQKCHFTL